MGEERPVPEQFLERLRYEEQEEEKKSRGKLKIFLGYAAGSGKTYAMLTAAHELLRQGVDVAAGYIEPHARPDTEALAEGIPAIPFMTVEYKGVTFHELDLDKALARRPQILLVDELAHTNARGCRNEKRYQDVRELLTAGISVYTTVNIQHLESLNDLVGSITGIQVRERVPDWVFDQADQVEVVDLEPEELLGRMREGKIYRPAQAERALSNFFRKEKLAALREIALRRAADRANRIAEAERNALGMRDYHTGEHVLVCISAAPSSGKVIRTAARLADAFHARFTGLCVETPELKNADEKTRAALNANLETARALGAGIVTVYGSEVVGQIAEYAMAGNVSKVVMGRTNHLTVGLGKRKNLMERMAAMAPNIDIYIIPDMKQTKRYHKKRTARREEAGGKAAADRLGAAALAAVAAFVLSRLELFFRLWSGDRGGLATFLLLFLAGLFVAAVLETLRRQNREIAKNAFRTELLLENSRKLRRCKTKREVWESLAAQAGSLMRLPMILYPVEETGILGEPMTFSETGEPDCSSGRWENPRERAVAQWVAANRRRAGATTHTLPDAAAIYLPIPDARRVRGVLGILLEERRPIKDFEYGLLVAMLNETGVKLQDMGREE